MKNFLTSLFYFFLGLNLYGQSSTNIAKTIRVNYHFMLKGNGTGNFNEVTDGDGRIYSGYDWARNQVLQMNQQSDQNIQMKIPLGNTLHVLDKNYNYVLDAVYFWRDDNTYYYYQADNAYTLYGQDKGSVMNVLIAETTGSTVVGGAANNVSIAIPVSGLLNKYIKMQNEWDAYLDQWNNLGYFSGWAQSLTTSHEFGHLLGLNHTVLYGSGAPCPVGCPLANYPNVQGSINYSCGDNITDTPTAWDITSSNNCTEHPGIFNAATNGLYFSNNLMDYSNNLCLSPNQIQYIHSGLELGNRAFTSCNAVANDLSLCDVGYPKVSYFGKNILVGNCGTQSDITNREKIDIYYSQSVELNNIEIRADSQLEIIFEPVCSF